MAVQRNKTPPWAASSGAALVLTGGGARAAYQAGVLSRLGEAMPDLSLPIITGVSAGAINAAFLANHTTDFGTATTHLRELWADLKTDRVIRVSIWDLLATALRWGLNLFGGGAMPAGSARGLVDTSPLAQLLVQLLLNPEGPVTAEHRRLPLPGIVENLDNGKLAAFALSTTSYTSGKSVTFVQSRQRDDSTHWSRPYRRSEQAHITVDHVMASASIPLLFPAIQLGHSWHGDGGVRQTAPLSPAVHLGAQRVLAISTLRTPPKQVIARDQPEQYPPPAQVMGVLVNSIFLDNVDYDAANLVRINGLLRRFGPGTAAGLRPVDLLVMRPSEDLGKIAAQYEHDLPRGLRYMSRGWGTKQTSSSDVLATVLFESSYTRHLIEVGRRDAERRLDQLLEFLAPAEPG